MELSRYIIISKENNIILLFQIIDSWNNSNNNKIMSSYIMYLLQCDWPCQQPSMNATKIHAYVYERDLEEKSLH